MSTILTSTGITFPNSTTQASTAALVNITSLLTFDGNGADGTWSNITWGNAGYNGYIVSLDFPVNAGQSGTLSFQIKYWNGSSYGFFSSGYETVKETVTSTTNTISTNYGQSEIPGPAFNGYVAFRQRILANIWRSDTLSYPVYNITSQTRSKNDSYSPIHYRASGAIGSTSTAGGLFVAGFGYKPTSGGTFATTATITAFGYN